MKRKWRGDGLTGRWRLLTGVVTIATLCASTLTSPASATAAPVLTPADPQQAPPPVVAVSPQWTTFSTAYLSPQQHAEGANVELADVSNAAEIMRVFEIDIARPQLAAGEAIELRILAEGNPLGAEMVIGNPATIRLPGAGGPQDYSVQAALSSVCTAGSVRPAHGTDDNNNYHGAVCRLDPRAWAANTKDEASATDASTPAPARGLSASGDSADQRLVLPLTLGAANDGSSRAAKLDSWLTRLAGDRLPDSVGAVDLSIPNAVQLVRVSGNGGPAQQEVIGTASLSWQQQFAAADSGFAFRTSVPVESNFRLAFNRLNAGDLADSESVPTDTSSNMSFGELNPGTRWVGSVTYTNLSQTRGWPGKSPFKQRGDKADAPYIFTDWAPSGVADVRVTPENQPTVTTGDCRDTQTSAGAVAEDMPEQLRSAAYVCAMGQEADWYLQPFLFPDASNAGSYAWDSDQARRNGNLTFNVSYDVPADYLRTVANDPANWTYEEDEVRQLVYVDTAGNPLPEPREETVKVGRYVSTAAPTAWNYVPKQCVAADVDGDESMVCGADALVGATGLDQTTLVKSAEFAAFQRSVCADCWAQPDTVAMQWTTAPDEPGEANANVMQGQSGNFAVAMVNQSQTPGLWRDLKVELRDLPAGVTVEPAAVARITGEQAAAMTATTKPDWQPAPRAALRCPNAAEGSVTCAFTDAMAEVPGMGKLWGAGQYLVMFEVSVGSQTPTSPEGTSYQIKSNFTYPHYKDDLPAFGSEPADAQTLELNVVPQSAAQTSIQAQVPTATSLTAKVGTNVVSDGTWANYVGDPVSLEVTTAAGGPRQTGSVRYLVSNTGQRWIRSGNQLRIVTTYPIGVEPIADKARTDLSAVPPEQRGQVAKYGEKWSCRTSSEPVQRTTYGLVQEWDVVSSECAATVGTRPRGWQSGAGVAAAFPALVMDVRGKTESVSDDTASRTRMSVWQPDAAGSFERISPEVNTNSETAVDIEVIDPAGVAPEVRPYWVSRPVAGGHAVVRIDVANANRPATKNLNLLAVLPAGSTYRSAVGSKWGCQPASGSRVLCHYDGTLAKDAVSAPLYLTAGLAPEMSGNYQLLAEAQVLAFRPDQGTGKNAVGISYDIGTPMAVDAGTTTDVASQALEVGDSAATAIDFTGPIEQPKVRASQVQLRAQSASPFAGQPVSYRWEQLCTEDAKLAEQGCSAKVAKVPFAPSADVPNPAITVPAVKVTTELKFQVVASDVLEPADSRPAPAPGSTNPQIAPNSATGKVSITVEPAVQTSTPSDPDRNAGDDSGDSPSASAATATATQRETTSPQPPPSPTATATTPPAPTVTPSPSPTATQSATTTPSPTPTPTPTPTSTPQPVVPADPGTNTVDPQCQTAYSVSVRSGVTYDQTKISRDGDKCVVSEGRMIAFGWLVIDEPQASIGGPANDIRTVVTSGRGSIPTVVSNDPGLSIDQARPLSIPANPKFPTEGLLSGPTVVFADEVAGLGEFAQQETVIDFRAAPGRSTYPASPQYQVAKFTSRAAEDADGRVLSVQGTLTNTGNIAAEVKLERAIKLPGDKYADFTGTIRYDKSTQRVVWDLTAAFGPFAVADGFVIDRLIVTYDGEAFVVRGSAHFGNGADPLKLVLSGSVNEGLLEIGLAKAPNSQWQALDGFGDVGVSGRIEYDFETAEVQLAELTVSAPGTVRDSSGTIGLAKPKLTVRVENESLLTLADASSRQVAIDVEATMIVAQPGRSEYVFPVTGTGGISGGKTTLSLAGSSGQQQLAISEGVAVEEVTFKLDYDSSRKVKVVGSFDGKLSAALPGDGGQVLVAQVNAVYDAKGLSLTGTAEGANWQVANGLTLSGIEIAYRSSGNAGTYDPVNADIPDIPDFQGLLVLGVFTPSAGNVLHDNLGMRKPLGAYVRVEPASKTYEAVLVSQDAIRIAGTEGSTSISVVKPYLKVTHTGVNNATTVGLGGTGTVTYPVAGGARYATYDKLSLAATLNISKHDFTGSLRITDKWVNAAGIPGLTLSKGAFEVSSTGSGTSAHFFAQVGAGDKTPDYLTSMGYTDVPITLGVGMQTKGDTTNFCAAMSIGDDKKVALSPLQFAGGPSKYALQITYADLVFATGECRIGERVVTSSAMRLKGSMINAVPVDINADAKPAADGSSIGLATPGGQPVRSASLGPATIEDATVGLEMNTAAPPQVVNSPSGPKLTIGGSFQLGSQKLTVAGGVVPKGSDLAIQMAAKVTPGKPVDLGGFRILQGGVNAELVYDIAKQRIDVEKGFRLGVDGKADILKRPFNVKVAVLYAGGAVQEVDGAIDASGGVAIGDRVIVAGTGRVAWSPTAGVRVALGSKQGPSSASVLVCTGKPVVASAGGGSAKCEGGKQYGVTNASVDIGETSFNVRGVINLGDWFTARVTGAYYQQVDPNNRPKITFAGAEYEARDGDYSFGIEDAKIGLPTGNASGSVAIARFTRDGQQVDGGRLAFTTPVLSGSVRMDGTFDTAGYYDIAASIKDMTLGGFTVKSGDVRVMNIDAGKPIATTVAVQNLNVDATIGKVSLSGKYGVEDGATGLRISGAMGIGISTFSGTANVIYSNFPRDAGFGIGFDMNLQGRFQVNFAGIFRNVNNQTLYRLQGGIRVPMGATTAIGTAQLDNCVDDQSLACVKPREINGQTTPLISLSAAVDLSGLATAAVKGDVRFDGAFRLVGSAAAGASYGPWSLFKVVTASAGFSMHAAVCFANTQATSDPNNRMGCGANKDRTWGVGLSGTAHVQITVNYFFSSSSWRGEVGVIGAVTPNDGAKFCATASALGYGVTFGRCPNPDDIPRVNPQVVSSEWI